MKKKIRNRGRPVTLADTQGIGAAHGYASMAYSLLREAGAYHAADKVRASFKSIQGARNHAMARLLRADA